MSWRSDHEVDIAVVLAGELDQLGLDAVGGRLHTFDPWGVLADARRWLQEEDGVIAKETDAPYRPGERVGMVKIKRVRTIDAVVMGWRPGKAEGTVGAIILGLHDGGRLREVGHSSGFTAKEKRELVALLAPYETGNRGSGEPSRWSAGRDLEWVELRPELVVEVTFDHTSNERIRHGAKILRWREDKDPRDCTMERAISADSSTFIPATGSSSNSRSGSAQIARATSARLRTP